MGDQDLTTREGTKRTTAKPESKQFLEALK